MTNGNQSDYNDFIIVYTFEKDGKTILDGSTGYVDRKNFDAAVKDFSTSAGFRLLLSEFREFSPEEDKMAINLIAEYSDRPFDEVSNEVSRLIKILEGGKK